VSVEGGASASVEDATGAPADPCVEAPASVDRTACALRLVDTDAHRFVREDAGEYDLLVIDPPPLAKRAADVERAARAHKDVLLFALRRAARSAHVFAFSCSHHIDAKLLRQIVFGASLDAGTPLVVLRELGAPSDHAVSLDHPEGAYLHGLWLRSAV
jgi:23S rRNA (cytosine1962-C5)-methyltransferase